MLSNKRNYQEIDRACEMGLNKILREVMPPEKYEDLSSQFAQTIRQKQEAVGLDFNKLVELGNTQLAGELSENGISSATQLLTHEQVSDIRKYLSDKGVYLGHIAGHSNGKSVNLSEAKEKTESLQVCYDQPTIFKAPHLMGLVLSSKILGTVAQFLGAVPTLYQTNIMINLYRKKLKRGKLGVAQSFHRDLDSMRFCTLFIFLTDCHDANTDGAHQYILGSHNYKKFCSIVKDAEEQGNFSKQSSPLKKSIIKKLKEMQNKKSGFQQHIANSALKHHWLKETTSDDFIKTYYDISSGYNNSHLESEVFQDQLVNITGPAGSGFVATPWGLHRGIPPKCEERMLFWARFGVNVSDFHGDNGYGTLDIKPYINAAPEIADEISYCTRLYRT